ncbi:hypothetical protein HanRHA438_Chr15g0727611 [Helianthus annuus]|nr:hypothetical protein HanIR_Chr15g0778301 [Helianthus annuus]KAJ0846674.1 hypothetical protein HanRHA438_Chr15g0727611 [Helianthus annuus]
MFEMTIPDDYGLDNMIPDEKVITDGIEDALRMRNVGPRCPKFFIRNDSRWSVMKMGFIRNDSRWSDDDKMMMIIHC